MLNMHTFEELVHGIRDNSEEAVKRVVFIGCDVSISQFGHAIHADYARTPKGSADVAWHVPGPRESFEGVWRGCGVPYLEADLDGAIVLSPFGSLDTIESLRFKYDWGQKYESEPLAVRAARTYDALMILEQVVHELDARLRDEQHYVTLRVYQLELRRLLERGRFQGVSGSFDFEQGEMGSASELKVYRAGVGLLPFSSLKELAVPRPTRSFARRAAMTYRREMSWRHLSPLPFVIGLCGRTRCSAVRDLRERRGGHRWRRCCRWRRARRDPAERSCRSDRCRLLPSQ